MEKDLMKDAGEASALLWKKTVEAVKKIPAKYKAFFGRRQLGNKRRNRQ